MALMTHLEAEDDGHGPVPMDVGAMKGKKGEKGKNNEHGKGTEKGKERGKKGKRKRTRKRREASAKYEFPGPPQVSRQVEAQGE